MQNARIHKTLNETHETVMTEHEKTRDIICAAIRDIMPNQFGTMERSTSNNVHTISTNRNIYFCGKRCDMIMAYLLLAKAQLEAIVHRISSSCTSEKISKHHIELLQCEIKHLVASAAQREASNYSGSTCMSSDTWIYSENVSRSAASSNNDSLTKLLGTANALRLETSTSASWKDDEHTRQHQGTFTHATPLGHLRFRTPSSSQASIDKQPYHEGTFAFTCAIGCLLHAISVRFFRQQDYDSRPRLYAQLNVFTLAKSEDPYKQLFATGTIKEVDTALRHGIISPYHINSEGRNLCLYVSIHYFPSKISSCVVTNFAGVVRS